jgi:hypothetical protein
MEMKKKMLVYFMTIRNILRPFGIIFGHFVYIVCGNLNIFFPFWYVRTKKNLATLVQTDSRSKGRGKKKHLDHFRVQVKTEGLPDGTFSDQKSQFEHVLEGLDKENVGTF